MIDTIGFRISFCPSDLPQITARLRTLCEVDGSGEVLSAFTRGGLSGSWDSRISVSVHDREWVWIEDETHPRGGRTLQVDCAPWLRVEFSLQKWLYGVNCFTYSLGTAQEALLHFRHYLQEILSIHLPYVEEWQLLRLDIGYLVTMGDKETLVQYLDHLRRVEYPRRKYRSVSYMSSVMWVGTHSTLKVYDKGAEFRAHDRRRLVSYFGCKSFCDTLEARIEGQLRIEASMRPQYLKSRGLLTGEDILCMTESEAMKIMGKQLGNIGLRDSVARIWTSAEVRSALRLHLGRGSGISPDAAFSIWVDMTVTGRAFARRNAGRNKFYRATRAFRELGISTVTTLTETEKAAVPMPVDLRPAVSAKMIAFVLSPPIPAYAHNLLREAA